MLKYPNPWMSNKKQAWIHRRSQTRPHWVFMLNTYLCISAQKSLTMIVITLGMVKDVVKLSKFHNSCIFIVECIQLLTCLYSSLKACMFRQPLKISEDLIIYNHHLAMV